MTEQERRDKAMLKVSVLSKAQCAKSTEHLAQSDSRHKNACLQDAVLQSTFGEAVCDMVD